MTWQTMLLTLWDYKLVFRGEGFKLSAQLQCCELIKKSTKYKQFDKKQYQIYIVTLVQYSPNDVKVIYRERNLNWFEVHGKWEH